MEITSGDKLVRFIENLNVDHEVDVVSCEHCHAARARVCARRFEVRIERIRAETRRYAEDAKTERAHRAFMRSPLPHERAAACTKSTSAVMNEERAIERYDSERERKDRGRGQRRERFSSQ